MPIGPTLPPHLQKAAAALEDDEDDELGPAPPSASTSASAGGPSVAGPSRPPPNSSIGPPLPPRLQSRGSGPADVEEEEENSSIGPSLPPHLLAVRQGKAAAAPTASPSRPPTMGPQRPPAAGPSRPPGWEPGSPPRGHAAAEEEEDSSDDDVVGPMPLPPGVEYDEQASAVHEFQARQQRWQKEREDALKPKELKREEWMLKPPEAMDSFASLDPTKIPRGQTSFSRTSAAPIKAEDQSLWTETPAERQQRLADEVMGKKKRKENSVHQPQMSEREADEARRRKKRDAELQEEIERHNKKHRSATLLDMHGQAIDKKKKKGSDDAPPPIWDRDLHMSVGGRLMDEKDRKAQIMDAKGLGSRFGHGKTGAYS